MKCTGLRIPKEVADEIYNMWAGTKDPDGVPFWSVDGIIKRVREKYNVEINAAHVWFYGDAPYADAVKMIRSFGLEVKKVLKDNFAEHLISYFRSSGKRRLSLEEICAYFSEE